MYACDRARGQGVLEAKFTTTDLGNSLTCKSNRYIGLFYLVKCQLLKSNIENKTTSVTTHFKRN